MGSKAEYEAAKAQRKAERDALIARAAKEEAARDELIKTALDGLDRFITAFERLADAAEVMATPREKK
jgi:hypothetical protein